MNDLEIILFKGMKFDYDSEGGHQLLAWIEGTGKFQSLKQSYSE